MMDKASMERELAAVRNKYGEWTDDIPLPHGLWTGGNRNLPQTRLRRILQIAHDLSAKPLAQCRVLDLGCLDGIYSIEFARHGAQVVGVDVREQNVRRAQFAASALELTNVEFRQMDVRELSQDKLGRFDIVVCSGVLYHLTADQACSLVATMFAMSTRLVIIDTHIALWSAQTISFEGREYHGRSFREHPERSSQQERAQKALSSWDNTTSFLFTRPSLVNLLTAVGFSSVYDCLAPPHLNYGKPGVEHDDRVAFVAVKGSSAEVFTSPVAAACRESWPEGTLTYATRSLVGRIIHSRRLRALLDRLGLR